MAFAQIARELREETGLSQKKFGDLIGLSSSGIAHLELGQTEPGSQTLLAYAKYFGVSVDFLLGLENDYGVKLQEPTNSAVVYSSSERALIEKYRILTPAGKHLIDETLKTLLGSSAGSGQQNNKIS